MGSASLAHAVLGVLVKYTFALAVVVGPAAVRAAIEVQRAEGADRRHLLEARLRLGQAEELHRGALRHHDAAARDVTHRARHDVLLLLARHGPEVHRDDRLPQDLSLLE